ncbi:MAG: MFS transporter [Deltaproteobacteria bacterium]|nr:MFS transporter [Deltaproteobacteria bacterium]
MTPPPHRTAAPDRAGTPFRGWWIVGVGLIAQAITIGLTIIPFGFFTTPLVEEFGASIAQVAAGLGLFTVAMTAVGGVVGRLVDRGSIRAVMACGSLVMAACFFTMSLATELWQLGALFGLGVASGVTLAGPLPATTVIAKWFDRKRGIAVGVASTGPLVGGALLTPLIGWLLDAIGWRATLQVFAGISALIAPLALAIIRNTPGEIGQRVDGETGETAIPVPGLSSRELSPREILHSRNFWALALAIGIVFGLGAGWSANVPRFGEDLGHTGQRMSVLIGASSAAGAITTLLFGALADRLGNRGLLWVCVAGQGLALLLLGSVPADPLFSVAVVLFGAASGGLLPVYAAYIGRLFGAPSFGSVMGLAGLVMLPFGAAAPVVAGAVRDTTGSYVIALLGFSLAFAVSCALLALIRTPAPDPQAYADGSKELA